jgi:hypothetical protein
LHAMSFNTFNVHSNLELNKLTKATQSFHSFIVTSSVKQCGAH